MSRTALPLALILGAVVIGGCHKNAREFDSIMVPPLPPDTFNPTSTIDRISGGGADFLRPARDNYSQTLLITGPVLIAGGTSVGLAQNVVEIYDQRPAEFFDTGFLRQARRGHTATVTSAGDVIVTGGLDLSGNPMASAEIYRTSTGTWTLIQSMAVARFGHSATRLLNGDLFVAGGVTTAGGAVTDSAQILNVSTLQFKAATPMQAGPGASFGQARAFHSATPVPRDMAISPLTGLLGCEPGDVETVVVILGGLTGGVGGPAAAIAGTVTVFFPFEMTDGAGGVPQPGRWQDMILGGSPAASQRWAHQAHFFSCFENPVTQERFADLLVVGGNGSFTPPLGALTSGVVGLSALEDSGAPDQTYALLEVSLGSLRLPNVPMGTIGPEICIANPPMCDTFFAGGAGSRSIFLEGAGLVLFAGGNTLDITLSSRVYSRKAYLIDPFNLTHVLSASEMSQDRSFFGMSTLAGPDEARGTADDTVLISGGELAPTAESQTAEEYAFP